MAERIDHNVKPTPTDTNAYQELDRLLEGLHENGVLRFANDVVRSQTQIAQVLVNGLGKEGTLNAIQNLSVLGMALSRIPPDDFYKMVFGLKDAMEQMNRHAGQTGDEAAPGLSGTYRMLHDDKLWASIMPLVEAIKVFADRMGDTSEKPVTRFTGKPTEM